MITYKEFEARVKEIDSRFTTEHRDLVLAVVNQNGCDAVYIEKGHSNELDSITPGGIRFHLKRSEILRLSVELATTPIDKRTKEKKYYYRKAWKDDTEDIFYTFLNFDNFSRRIMHSKYDNESSDIQTQFTKGEYEPISEPVRVFMTFYRPLPKTLTKLNREAHEQGQFYPRTRPDVDNYVKGLLDALSGIVYTDDNIIIQITADKKYADKGRIEFEIEVI